MAEGIYPRLEDWHPCAMTAARATCHADDHPYTDERKQHERDIRQVQIHGYKTSMPYYRQTGKENLPGHHPCCSILFTRPEPLDNTAVRWHCASGADHIRPRVLTVTPGETERLRSGAPGVEHP